MAERDDLRKGNGAVDRRRDSNGDDADHHWQRAGLFAANDYDQPVTSECDKRYFSRAPTPA